MCAQLTYDENRNNIDNSVSPKSFHSKILSRKGRGLENENLFGSGVMESVEVLILDGCQLNSIPVGAIEKCFPKLRVLSLKECSLEKVSIEVFSHPTLEIIDFEGSKNLSHLAVWEGMPPLGSGKTMLGFPSLQVLNLEGTNLTGIDKEFFTYMPGLLRLHMHSEGLCGGCGFGFLGILEVLECLKITGVRTGSCNTCKPEKNSGVFSTAIKYSLYNMVCKMESIVELDLSGKGMNIDYFVFHTPLPYLASLRMQGKLVRDMSLRDWPGIVKTIRHLSLGVIDGTDDASGIKAFSESTFYAERILEATNLESLSFDCETSRRIKFSLGTKKVVFPYLRHLTIKNCDLRPLTFFNKENAPVLDSLEIISTSFTEGYFYTIKKRLGNRLRSLRIGIERMDAPQAIYDLFTFIRSHKNLEILHLSVCETITESQSFYKYFSDQPSIKELYIIGKMSLQRMKRFLYQLGKCSSLTSLLLDIEDPATVLSNFHPIKSLHFFSIKGTYRNHTAFFMAQGSLEEDFTKLMEMPSLEVLDLSGCGFSVFPSFVLPHMNSLKYLYLNNNNVHDLSDQVLSYLATVKDRPLFIDISENPIDIQKIEMTLNNETSMEISGFVIY